MCISVCVQVRARVGVYQYMCVQVSARVGVYSVYACGQLNAQVGVSGVCVHAIAAQVGICLCLASVRVLLTSRIRFASNPYRLQSVDQKRAA